MKHRRSVSEIVAIALVLSALGFAASSLFFDSAANIAQTAQDAYRQDSRAKTFRDQGLDNRISQITGPRSANASSSTR